MKKEDKEFICKVLASEISRLVGLISSYYRSKNYVKKFPEYYDCPAEKIIEFDNLIKETNKKIDYVKSLINKLEF